MLNSFHFFNLLCEPSFVSFFFSELFQVFIASWKKFQPTFVAAASNACLVRSSFCDMFRAICYISYIMVLRPICIIELVISKTVVDFVDVIFRSCVGQLCSNYYIMRNMHMLFILGIIS